MNYSKNSLMVIKGNIIFKNMFKSNSIFIDKEMIKSAKSYVSPFNNVISLVFNLKNKMSGRIVAFAYDNYI